MLRDPVYIFPEVTGFKGTVLDDYLALGYYRMQHLIFTTNHTQLDMERYRIPVFWLRTLVKRIKENKSSLTIRKKCAAFTVRYKKAIVTEEIEALYDLYRNHVNFSTAEKCADYLHEFAFENPYDSWMIEVRNGTKLIAVGYFDKGQNASAGILNIYHPQYHKYSLGKLLILKKIDFALENNIALYYTGYISTAITKFDYKLFPDINAMEVYLPIDKKWVPYTFYGKELLEEYFFNGFV